MDMLQGMNNALNYIEDNLASTIELNEVANRAFCSEYHFKRLFTILSGITILSTFAEGDLLWLL
nr:hypothetical protein [Bacillus alkalisoli]